MGKIVIELAPDGKFSLMSDFDEPTSMKLLHKALEAALNTPLRPAEPQIVHALTMPRFNGNGGDVR